MLFFTGVRIISVIVCVLNTIQYKFSPINVNEISYVIRLNLKNANLLDTKEDSNAAKYGKYLDFHEKRSRSSWKSQMSTSWFLRMLRFVSMYFQRRGAPRSEDCKLFVQDAKLEIEISIEFMDRSSLCSLAKLNLHLPMNILSNVRVGQCRRVPACWQEYLSSDIGIRERKYSHNVEREGGTEVYWVFHRLLYFLFLRWLLPNTDVLARCTALSRAARKPVFIFPTFNSIWNTRDRPRAKQRTIDSTRQK